MPDRGGMGLQCAPLGLGRVAMPRRGRLDPLVVATTALREGAISVVDYRCTAGPGDTRYAELHRGFSVSYVRRGSFGYRHPGDEFTCTHEHVVGDGCLSVTLDEATVDEIGARRDVWRTVGLPPMAELV